MADNVVVESVDFQEAGPSLTGLERGLEMVVACIFTYSRGIQPRLPRLSDHIARRELAGERRLARGYQADRCACPSEAVHAPCRCRAVDKGYHARVHWLRRWLKEGISTSI